MMTSAEDAAATATMIQLLAGFQVSQAMYVVAELGAATVLDQEGSQTVAELARRTDSDPEALARLIRTLTPMGLFSTDGEKVSITPVGATLSETHPRSLHGLARMWMQTHYLPFSELTHSVRVGQPGASKYLGEPLFDWLSRDARREALFSQAMAELTASLRAGVFEGYQLPLGSTVADIGGANASVLIELLTRDADSSRRGIVFDRPDAVLHAQSSLAAAGLTDRVELICGDFFVAVPPAEIYLLGFILHDWDDEHSQRILESIAAAADEGARLVIVEMVVPPGDGPHLSKAVDLTMLGMLTGKERTEHEYRRLLNDSGFTLDRVVATPSPVSILEATRH